MQFRTFRFCPLLHVFAIHNASACAKCALSKAMRQLHIGGYSVTSPTHHFPLTCPTHCWAGAQGFPGPSACASGAICMLFMMSGILSSSALPCSVIGTLPCSVLLKTPCSCLCGSAILWGWRNLSRIVLKCLVPWMMLLMMHQPHLHQPWRLDRCSPFIHSCPTPSDTASHVSFR